MFRGVVRGYVYVHLLWTGSITFSEEKRLITWFRQGEPPGPSAGEDQRQVPNRESCQQGSREECRQERELDVKIWKIMLIITSLTEHLLCGRQRARWPGTQLILSSSSTFGRWGNRNLNFKMCPKSSGYRWQHPQLTTGHVTLKPTRFVMTFPVSLVKLQHHICCTTPPNFQLIILSSKVTHFRAGNHTTIDTVRRRKGERLQWLLIVLVPERIDYLLR